jgi:hypothetical protein
VAIDEFRTVFGEWRIPNDDNLLARKPVSDKRLKVHSLSTMLDDVVSATHSTRPMAVVIIPRCVNRAGSGRAVDSDLDEALRQNSLVALARLGPTRRISDAALRQAASSDVTERRA